ncbi:MAG: S26 family signal peptidase, partial [Gaiellaceae bacterium]
MIKNPLERLLQRLPQRARVAADWLIGIVVAVIVVLAFRAWVVTPYAIPTSSMEPTLHCAPTKVKTSAPTSSLQPSQSQSTTTPSQRSGPLSAVKCQGTSFLGAHFSDRV